MAKQKLTYRFHNPNTVESTAEALLEVFVKVNEEKVERAIQACVTDEGEEEDEIVC